MNATKSCIYGCNLGAVAGARVTVARASYIGVERRLSMWICSAANGCDNLTLFLLIQLRCAMNRRWTERARLRPPPKSPRRSSTKIQGWWWDSERAPRRRAIPLLPCLDRRSALLVELWRKKISIWIY